MRVEGIVLAAGESSRMNRSKALLPWGNYSSLLEYQVVQMREAGCMAVIVVTGADDQVASVARSLGAVVMLNPDWREGRASSTRTGANAAHGDAVVVVNVDQPAPADLLKQLFMAISENPSAIHVPTYQAKRGHPVVIPGSLIAELQEVQEETRGLHRLIDDHPPVEIELDEPLITADINTPEDYASWHERVFGVGPG